MRFRSTPQKNKFHKLSESTEQLNSGILVSSKDKPDEVSSEAEYVISSSGPVIFDISRKRYGYRFTKRLFDILFSLVVCITLCIPVGILCLVISLDSPGFPIFSQNRVGRFGKPIKVLKLRTMYSDAHSNPEKYFNEEQMKCWLREYKVENDPRVTKIGCFLRKTSLDELPQFLNVLKGDIPLRILKTRPEFSEKSMGAFALPAKSSTNKEKAFSQVASCFASGLRMRRISGFNCKRVGSIGGQFLAKPVFKAVCA